MKKFFTIGLLILLSLLYSDKLIKENTTLLYAEDLVAVDKSYKELWKEVKNLNSKGLPKSALKVVNQIGLKARHDRNETEEIKALIHKIKYIQQVEEDSLVKINKELKLSLKKASPPVKALLHSMIAEQYWNFYLRNRYRFLKRSKTNSFKQDDIKTWSLEKITEEVVNHYKLSLKDNKTLKRIKLDKYKSILANGTSIDRENLRPTLYDFIAHRAIDFFISSESSITTPVDSFSLNNKDYLSVNSKFASLEIETKDDLSFKFYALKYLQDLTRFHIGDKKKSALFEIDIKRLNFVYNNIVIENKNNLYESTLKKSARRYANYKDAPLYFYQLAKYYNQLGDKYNPESRTEYKWFKQKAIKLCQKTIKNYPDSFGILQCKALIDQIKLKSLDVTFERATLPEKPFTALVNYRNINKIYIRAIKFTPEEGRKISDYSRKKLLNYFLKKPANLSQQINFKNDGDFHTHSTEIGIKPLKSGKYIFLISNNKIFSKKNSAVAYSSVDVTNISYITKKQGKKLELYTFHRESGAPLKGVEIQQWYRKSSNWYSYKKGEIYKSDKNGYITIKGNKANSRYFKLEFKYKKDIFFPDMGFNTYGYKKRFYNKISTHFFTDRSIYRPGQTIHFKGIKLFTNTKDGGKVKILKNRYSTVSLFDKNNQLISSLQLKTNNYGTFSGTFQIPTGLLNGRFKISDGRGSTYISVEEYKRPKFEVTFKELKDSYKLNDIITVAGNARAFGGFNIDNGKVKYRIVRNNYNPYGYYYWSYFPTSKGVEISNGYTKTDYQGNFKIKFKALPDNSISKKYKPNFHYTIYADVTDITGETRSNSKIIYAGYRSLFININMPEIINKDIKQYKGSINSTNISGAFTAAKGQIEIFRLKTPERILKKRLWNRPDIFNIKEITYKKKYPNNIYDKELNHYKWKKIKKVYSFKFDTSKSKDLTLKIVDRLASGKYLIEAKSRDNDGNMVKAVKYITIYSPEDKKPPYKMLSWFVPEKLAGKPGEKASFIIGSSEKNVTLLFEIKHRGKITEKKFIKLNNEQKQISIPIKEKHRGNFGINLTFIKHNRIFKESRNIIVPWSNKSLKLSFETFRNKLYPGEKEEWRIKIKGPDNTRVAAEMAATLYDASLDAFRSHGWHLSPFPYERTYNRWNNDNGFSIRKSLMKGNLNKWISFPQRLYDTLNWFGFYWHYDHFYYSGGRGRIKYMMNKSSARLVESKEMEESPTPMNKKVKKKSAYTVADMESGSSAENNNQKTAPVQMRKNFNETAFFFPHLKSNKDGEVTISFTMPDSITRWKMLGFAHTENLELGFISNSLETRKDLMVIPNRPRFFREGDDLVFTAKVVNLSDKKISGMANLQFFDAATMKPLKGIIKKEESVDFSSAKGKSALVKWRLHIPDNSDSLTYRITAVADNFSDGEEDTLPVLKNRMLVTETLPLPLNPEETREFKFKKLIDSYKSETMKHHKLTLEFTSNPAWYAVQALPYMMEYPYECSEQTFSRYYANSIAHHIVKNKPKIQRVFKQWQNTKSSNALLSSLEKNQELKTIMLEETPWVLNAQSETERKRRIGLLFNLTHMSSELSRTMKKIIEGQHPSGAWPWFKGMRPNRYITHHIISGFAHLKKLNVIEIKKDRKLREVIKKALNYMDNRINRDYQQLVKRKVDLKKYKPNQLQIHYLYARSNFKEFKIDDKYKKAFNYYKEQAKKKWLSYRRYMQGMIAMALHNYGDSKTPMDILKSIKEHALHSKEMGMYWKDSNGFYWYEAPIETHALLIEAFSLITDDKKSVSEMKKWLLKQKQTEDWKTTRATAEACYALLLNGDDWLENNRLPDITIGSIKVEPEKMDGVKVEAGTGYFKTSWSGKEIKPEMGNIKVKNNNKSIGWGGLYWQYFEDLDKITPHSSPLKIRKKLFVERDSRRGPELIPIDKTSVKVGERVKVRIVIEVDRSMEFIHLKDMRASGFEPENVISRFKWQDGLGYYESTKDGSTNFFIDYLPKGTYVFEYPLRATHEGNFSNGITTIQSMYAPEFSSHSKGIRLNIGE